VNRPPASVILIGVLFMATGLLGLVYHSSEFVQAVHVEPEFVWVAVVRLLAVIGGLFLLRGHNWARWLLVVWTGYHVVLSAFHSRFELIVHAFVFAATVAVLFRASASTFFRRPTAAR
jgi:hypothetical protein